MNAREFRFEGGGTSFYLVATTGTRQGVVLALPELHWSYSMSDHAAPNPGWLREHGLKGGDAKVLAEWLSQHWREVVGKGDPPVPTVLVLTGGPRVGKTLLGRRLEALGARHVTEGDLDGTGRHDVVRAMLPHNVVVVSTNVPPSARTIATWRKIGIVHVVTVEDPDPDVGIGIAGMPLDEADDLGGGRR